MKKTQLLTGLSFAFIFIIIASSCKKDNNGGGSGVSATINGAAWQSAFAAGEHSGGYLFVTGAYFKGSDSSGFAIYIHDSVKVGQTDHFGLTSVDFIKTSNNKDYSSDTQPSHGTLTLSSFDKNGHKASGTFSGVLYDYNTQDSIKIENGHFNVTYIED